MKEVIIRSNDAGQRLDKFLLKSFPHLTKGAMYKAIRNKKIKVNRKRASFDQMLEEGDVLLLFLAPDLLEKEERSVHPLPPVEIVYEDDHLLVLNKPAGLLSMKDAPEDQDTLNDRLRYLLYKRGDWNPDVEQSFVPSIAHRLDRNTSGLVLAAKDAPTARFLAEAIRDHKVEKSYLAITRKKPKQGREELFLKKEGTIAKISKEPAEGYVPAILNLETIKEDPDRKLVLSRVDLETGRFHQIRATLGFLGSPLARDLKYGDRKGDGSYALQAWQIKLPDPKTGKPIMIALPEDERLSIDRLPQDF